MTETAKQSSGESHSDDCKRLSPAAQRALAEAEERRRLRAAQREKEGPPPKEFNGRGGLDPVRYGDWEIKGLISDF